MHCNVIFLRNVFRLFLELFFQPEENGHTRVACSNPEAVRNSLSKSTPTNPCILTPSGYPVFKKFKNTSTFESTRRNIY